MTYTGGIGVFGVVVVSGVDDGGVSSIGCACHLSPHASPKGCFLVLSLSHTKPTLTQVRT